MPKSRSPSDKTIKRWIKMGFGQGSGPKYKPFFFVRDVPSRGRSAIVEGLKLKRKHHYLSDIEYAYHVLAEFSDSVIEIREQYALLPVEETVQIAGELGISHPIYSATGAHRVQTSDLVLTVKTGTSHSLHVLCCKPASDIEKTNPKAARTLEKILIEKTFWERRSVPWTLATDTMIPYNKFRNLDLFRASMVARELDSLNCKIPEFLSAVRKYWSKQLTLNQLLTITSDKLGINNGDCFHLLGQAIWTKLLVFNLDSMLITHENYLPELLRINDTCLS
ncbi:hypothetical protein BTA51_23875 [Hahella sp. CCB-MM4]|nr:hypothetical protein BTA51_23875 [Hahella sp. CCB-MM4]